MEVLVSIISVVVLLVFFVVADAIDTIKKHVKQNLKLQTVNQKIMRKVICKLAEKQGLSEDELQKIYNESIEETN